MSILNVIETYHNKIADQDFIWFPFIFLKPDSKQPISFPRIIVMTLAFGSYSYLFYILRSFFINELVSFESSVVFLIWSYTLFLIHFKFITSYFWNRRVRHFINHNQ